MLSLETADILAAARKHGWVLEPEVLRLLGAAGVPGPKFAWAKSKTDALAAAADIGYPGISGTMPENTLAAFARACETPGIDMIELDVRLSRDDVVVVLHDRTLQRTSTGNGSVRHYSVSEIKEFDAGSWFDRSFSNERIPTLREVLTLVDKRRWINVELKSDFFFPQKHELLEQRVLETVRSLDYQDHVLYSSFNHRMVGTIRRLDPGAKTGVLYNVYRDYGRLPSKLAGHVGAEVFVCAKHELTRKMLDDARNAGLGIYVYTQCRP